MGDIGAVAELLNTWSKWLLTGGFEELTLEQKLTHLRQAAFAAIEAGAWETVDRCLAEYRRLRADTA